MSHDYLVEKAEMRRIIRSQIDDVIRAGKVKVIPRLSAEELMSRHAKRSFYGRNVNDRKPPTKPTEGK